MALVETSTYQAYFFTLAGLAYSLAVISLVMFFRLLFQTQRSELRTRKTFFLVVSVAMFSRGTQFVIDPIPDILECVSEIRSFCMKDHRNWPKDEDCAPGFGEIDHYRLLDVIAHTGQTIPLCCENIAIPLVPRATTPEEIDLQARRTKIYLETVIAGLHAKR